MSRTIAVFTGLFVALAAFGAQPVSARADVAYTEILGVTGSQPGRFLSSRSRVFVGDGAIRKETLPRQKATPKIQTTIIPNLEGLLPRIEIISKHKNLAWSISPSGRLRGGKLRQVMAQADPMAEPANLRALANLQVSNDRAVLRRTGFKKKINGYVCEHLFATVTSDVRDRRTGEEGTLVLMCDLWVADNAPGANEIRTFRRSLGRAFGLDEYFCADAALLAEVIPEQAAKLAELVAQVIGLPVSNTCTAKLMKSSGGRAGRTELLYALKSDLIDIRSVRSDPGRFEPPIAMATSP
jgi:hypothetical protein